MKRLKVYLYEFRSDCYEFGFLAALNRLVFDYRFLHTYDLSWQRQRAWENYIKRKLLIDRFYSWRGRL